ncbi:MAG: hypothetical protein DSY95_02730 [SAR324 cluster bacterium]|uniref:Uncharacterized protein n=1 Tax=SAR324 cluster bacterium TaxID=2024889 RepID=A0A432GU59_9DELT|nr:MAG: hypothetical protein DSY95_02730 [SAR324 cluster bacterium]
MGLSGSDVNIFSPEYIIICKLRIMSNDDESPGGRGAEIQEERTLTARTDLQPPVPVMAPPSVMSA